MGGFGYGPYQFSGDGGSATSAVLSNPQDVVVDSAGDLFVADAYNNVVREVYASGIITTVAGSGAAGYAGDGGPTTSAELNGPTGLALDGAGDLFIADSGNSVIREVKPGPGDLLSLGTILTFAGGGLISDPEFSGSATDAALSGPSGLAMDGSGNLYIADTGNGVIREVSGGNISTIAAAAGLNAPAGLAIDGQGNLYIADTGNNVVDEVSGGNITTIAAGVGLNAPTGLAIDGQGNLYIADTGNNMVDEVSGGNITTIAAAAGLNAPAGLAIDGQGNLYIADSGNNLVSEVSGGNMTTVAGNISASAMAPWARPSGLAVDGQGNLFVADDVGNVVYEVSPSGSITTLASNLIHPTGLAVDTQGDLFIADAGHDVVLEVTPGHDGLSDGTMIILAGNGNAAIPATTGRPTPRNLIWMTSGMPYRAWRSTLHGDLFIADSGNDAVREVLADPGTGTVSPTSTMITYASGAVGPSSDYSPDDLQGIAVDAQGDLFMAINYSSSQPAIWELTPDGSGGLNYTYYYAPFSLISGLAVDAQGDLFEAITFSGIVEQPHDPNSPSTWLISYPPGGFGGYEHALARHPGRRVLRCGWKRRSHCVRLDLGHCLRRAHHDHPHRRAEHVRVRPVRDVHRDGDAPGRQRRLSTGSIQFEVDGTDFGSPVDLVNGSATASHAQFAVGREPYGLGGLYERLRRLPRQHGEHLPHGRGPDGVQHPVRRQQCPVILRRLGRAPDDFRRGRQHGRSGRQRRQSHQPRDGHAGPRRRDLHHRHPGQHATRRDTRH